MTTRSHRVLAAYHQVHLAPIGFSPVLDPDGDEGGLARTTDGGRSLVVLTGIAMGAVVLHVEDAPARAGDVGVGGQWQQREVLQIDVVGPLFVSAPTLVDAGPPDPVYVPAAPGLHVVTVLGRGRSTGRYDDVMAPEDDPFEEYVVRLERL